MSEFVDITLLECNRNEAIEKDTDKANNSLFTNRLGDNVRLEIGDTISIDSAFVNQKGCANLNSIEFTGNTIGKGQFFSTEGIHKVTSNLPYFMDNTSFWYKTSVRTEKTLKDNEVTIPVNYYKNSNGEGYCFLPRSYYGDNYLDNASHPYYNKSQDEWNESIVRRDTDATGFKKGLRSGICYYAPTDTDWALYNSNDYHRVWEDPLNDATKTYVWVKPKNDNSRFTMFKRDFYFKEWEGVTYEDLEGNIMNGGEWWERDETKIPENSSVRIYSPKGNRSPALSDYTIYQELLDLKIKKGFNTPQSISKQVTEQLQEEINSSPDQFINRPVGSISSQELTSSIETKLYKTMTCASVFNFSKTNFEYFDSMIGTERNTAIALNYWSSNNCIYVKRPEIFIEGRKCNNWFGNVDYYNGLGQYISSRTLNTVTEQYGEPNFIKNLITMDTTHDNSLNAWVTTSWIYNEINLRRLNELFKAQGKYPELFGNTSMEADDNLQYVNDPPDQLPPYDWVKATIDNSRFLHMNIMNTSIHYSKLGSDGYTENGRAGHHDASMSNINYQTAPFFFKYDINNVDKYINEPSTDNLSYGFATKTILPDAEGKDREYIVIHPELVNGLQPIHFKHRGGLNTKGNIVVDTVMVGWDYHYNSWGNVVMTGFSGVLPQNYDYSAIVGSSGYYSITPEPLVDYFNSTYIGANNTALTYNSSDNKFAWEYLHTPENIGNPWNAGATNTVYDADGKLESSTNIQAVTGAGHECYKINKRLTFFTYCPDCIPYEKHVSGQPDNEYNKVAPIQVSLLNKNIQPWTIFDSHMGVNFNFGDTLSLLHDKKGKEKSVWERSLLGILGFTYDQYNPIIINNSNNGQARVKNNNLSSLYNPTTNAQILLPDTKEMVVNHYGNPMYTTQVSMPWYFPKLWLSSGVDLDQYGYYPALSLETTSIQLEALTLPQVVSVPYLTIRTDLISESKYIGGVNGGLKLPIIAVVNKINADKDYIQLAESSLQFTCKQPVNISSITTTITNPDGQLADTGENNSVIYKIQKQNNLNKYNIMEQILQKKK